MRISSKISDGWNWQQPAWNEWEEFLPQRTMHRDTAELCEDPFDWEGEFSPMARLSAAIVMQAVLDWQEAKERLQVQPFHEESRLTVEETEAFFLSDWFEKLTMSHGDDLLKKMKEEFGA